MVRLCPKCRCVWPFRPLPAFQWEVGVSDIFFTSSSVIMRIWCCGVGEFTPLVAWGGTPLSRSENAGDGIG